MNSGHAGILHFVRHDEGNNSVEALYRGAVGSERRRQWSIYLVPPLSFYDCRNDHEHKLVCRLPLLERQV